MARGLGRRQRAALQALREALALHQLRDVIDAVLRAADVEDLDDSRVADARQKLRLTLESLDPDGVLGPPRLDDLDRHRALQPAVETRIDTAESALADQIAELVAAVENTAGEVGGAGHEASG